MTLNIAIKNILASFCSGIGFLNYLSRTKRRDSAFILTYHRVLGLRIGGTVFVQPGMYVTAASFRRQVAFLKEKFHVISLTELVERVETGKCISGCCAITFDDGWHDNFTHAFPILQEFQVPATVFLATSLIGTNQMFWPEELVFYLRQPDVVNLIRQRQVLTLFIKEVGGCVADESFLDNAIMVLKNWLPHKREKVLQELRFMCPDFPPSRLLMDWKEAQEMQSSGLISFGAHTANHVILDQVSLLQAEEEIVSSRRAIVKRLGTTPELFAYPNGNYSSDLQDILKRNDFRGAVTTRKRWIDEDTGLFEIPRIGMHEDVSCTIPLFFARILLERF